MASPISKEKETPAITHRQKFEGHTEIVWGAIHLPGGQRIITCSGDGSLRVWNSKTGKQIGEDWRDGDSPVWSIALSPDGKKVVSGSSDGAVRLWDIDTCKVVKKWTGHTKGVASVCWSRDGRRVLSGSSDGTARQWEVESGETMSEPIEIILASIETGHDQVYAVVYSPDTTLIATGGQDGPYSEEPIESSVKIWDAKTGKLVATLKGHTDAVWCLAWTEDGKTLISGSQDSSIRTWNTTNWEQTAVLDNHTGPVFGIAISPNGRILASASWDKTVRLWNLENRKPISSPLQHADNVNCVSFSAGGKQLATGCDDKNAYIWDVATILREAALDDLLSDPNAKKSALHVNATRPPIQVRPPVNRVPQGFFDGVPPSHVSSAQSHTHSSALPASTFLSPLFGHSPSDAHETSPSSPLDWSQNFLKPQRQSAEQVELQGRSLAVLEVPYAKGKRRNASAGERRERPLPWQNSAASSSRPPKPSATQQSGTAPQTQPSLQPQPALPPSSHIHSVFSARNDESDDLSTEAILRDLSEHITKDEDYPVARGGFGEIWKCTFHVDRRTVKVAVKALQVYAADQLGAAKAKKIKRIKRELRICANLKHANILPVYGYTRGFGPFIAIVSPWAENGNLSDYLELEGAALMLVRRFEILRDIIAGLQYLHANNVIHGDFNGPNVLIHGDGTACVADFGLSLMYSEVISASQASWTSTLKGNMRWMAPELLVSEREDGSLTRPSEQSDIFSFGGIILQVLTNKIPYYYLPNDAAIVLCIARSEKPSRTRYPELPEKYWTLIERCWSTDPRNRPSTEDADVTIRNEFYALSRPH